MNSRKKWIALLAILFSGSACLADHATDTIVRNGFTLVFINRDTAFDPATKQRMIDAFFTVYPQQVKRFNPSSLKTVTFIIDPTYVGVAATSNGIVRYNPDWMRKHPEDIDVVTHEVMHVVQSYRGRGGPGWLTEGIADYARYVYGINNLNGKWALPAFKQEHSYTNSYRITARFLVWLEQSGHTTIVDQLDKASRGHVYTPELWKTITGKTVDELWVEYAKNSHTVKLEYR